MKISRFWINSGGNCAGGDTLLFILFLLLAINLIFKYLFWEYLRCGYFSKSHKTILLSTILTYSTDRDLTSSFERATETLKSVTANLESSKCVLCVIKSGIFSPREFIIDDKYVPTADNSAP